MNPSTTTVVEANNQPASNELFALTDEQILEIAPDSSDPAPVAQPILAVRNVGRAEPEAAQARFISNNSQDAAEKPALPEPPPWLAAQMKDLWNGDEARDLWNGILQARQEAAAYREVFDKPEEARALREDARALKELYPGGVEQARAAAERARTMEEIDAAFYGGAGKSPEQQSAGRADLAQRMLREDPAAFREMVFAGLRALEAAGQSAARSTEASTANGTRADAGLPAENAGPANTAGKPSATQTENAATVTTNPHLDAYRTFEKSANEELERSVGGAINRALEQAFPAAQAILPVRGDARTAASTPGANQTAQARFIAQTSRDGNPQPALQERLGSAIRSDVETALKGDRQLGEQIAQLLSARRFDDTTRAQVVRLINDRAQQLVPVAARRVIQDWSQTAFAAHRSKSTDSPPDFRDSNVAPGFSPASATAVSAKAAAADRAENAVALSQRPAPRNSGRPVDYRKLSDEQILNL